MWWWDCLFAGNGDKRLIDGVFCEIVFLMKLVFRTFVFEGYEFFEADKKLVLRYSFDSEVFFEEIFVFDFDFLESYSEEVLEAALFGLWVMAGVSYFKAVLPSVITFKSGGLSSGQRAFFEKVYRHGLGEFFYVNGIDPHGKINFPEAIFEAPVKNRKLKTCSGSLVPIGGGKDSLVTAEMLKQAGEDFESFMVKPTLLLNRVCKKIGKLPLRVYRTISPQLLLLNQQGGLNGHVPITAIIAFVAVVTAVLRGKRNVVFSNEASAGEGNLLFHGELINHQYSKTLVFERDFQQYVDLFVSPDIECFSLLRPLSELKIAQLFCSKVFPNYQTDFSSCNRNFHFKRVVGEKLKPIWCGICPKCAFVFVMFAPFLSRHELISLFGKNLFADLEMDKTFLALLGETENKPFECVGTVVEVRKAFVLAQRTGEWPELERFDVLEEPFDYECLGAHRLSERFEALLHEFLKFA